MGPIDASIFNQIVELLIPHMGDSEERRALVEQALYGSPVLAQIRWDGAARPFTVALVRRLIDFGEITPGKLALIALLEQVKTLVGTDQKAQIDNLLASLRTPKTSADVSIQPPEAKMEKDLYIFISYARPNQAVAEQVELYLTAAGVKVFRDAKDIDKGDNWDMVIEKALQEADQMVLLLSSASMPYRKEVHREWFYFDQVSKPIRPLYLEKCQLHSRMYAYNYIDASTDLQKALEQLLAALGHDYTPPPELTSADRVMVLDDAVVEPRTLPQIFEALQKAVTDPTGSVYQDVARDKVYATTDHNLPLVDNGILPNPHHWT